MSAFGSDSGTYTASFKVGWRTQWFGPFGIHLEWPLVWRCRFEWVWGYWR